MNGIRVCREDCLGNLLSLRNNQSMVHYKIGEITVPRVHCGPLTVFDSIEHAKRFVHDLYPCHLPPFLHLFTVEFFPSQERLIWSLDKYFCADGSRSYISVSLDLLPPGTILAEWARLVERIDDESTKDK